MFSGLLFCGDCRAKLYFATTNHFTPNQEHFFCSGAQKKVEPCTAHYIREHVLKDLVLENLRQTLSFASEQKRTLSTKRKTLSKAQARTHELDKLFQRIYEDNVAGKLSDAQFEKLSKTYEDEQNALDAQIATLIQDLENEERQAINLDQFFKLVRKYTDIQELNSTILNELIEKILIYAQRRLTGNAHNELKFTTTLWE